MPQSRCCFFQGGSGSTLYGMNVLQNDTALAMQGIRPPIAKMWVGYAEYISLVALFFVSANIAVDGDDGWNDAS